MGASDDEEEYVVYGRPLQEEQESVKGQYNKEVQDKAVTKALPVWQQEVTDEQGRRRLHGAFTGGYSAGFFNTVGSKEGWAPSTFKSSRGQRPEARQSTAEDFMDEDELQELRKDVVQTGKGYDTFGHAAAEQSRKTNLSEQAQRPGLASLDLSGIIAPVPESIGIQLLQKMGWRQGKGIGKQSSHRKSESGSKWGPMKGVSVENVQVHRLALKDDTHGLGFDPFKGAEDFRSAKRQRDAAPSSSSRPAKKGPGVAFGSGVMDEDDVYGMTDDYVTAPDAREGYDFDLADEETDSPKGGARVIDAAYLLPGQAEPLRIYSKEQASAQEYDLIPGFTRAKAVERTKHFPPPKLPKDFKPVKVYPPKPTETVGAEPPVPRPEVLTAIKSVAPFVASVGPSFEALALQKNPNQPAFQFLVGGEGSEYYRWQLRALRAARKDQSGLAIGQRTRPLSVGDRGLLLGEAAAAAAALPGLQSAPKNFSVTDIADNDRQALQQTLQSTFARGKKQDMGLSGGADLTTYGLRAGKAPTAAAKKILEAAGSKFASAGAFEVAEQSAGGLSVRKEKLPTAPPKEPTKPRAPRRTVEEWRPDPLLCRRFNVPDPFRGQAAPAVDGPKFRTDTLALPETAAADNLALPSRAQNQEQLPLPPPRPREAALQIPEISSTSEAPAQRPQPAKDAAEDFLNSLMETTSIAQEDVAVKPKIEAPQEKPIDLFKAIFEEGSSDEDSDSQEGDAEKEGNSNTGQKALAYSAMPALPRGQAREPEPEAIAKIIFRPQAKSEAGAPILSQALDKANGQALTSSGHVAIKGLSPVEAGRSERLPSKTEEPNGRQLEEAMAVVRKAKRAEKDGKKHKKAKKEKGEKKSKKAKKEKHKRSRATESESD